ncbi:MAG: hypothetical protein KKD77_21775 [Gammaproteobacteria bacterium]|nr:hypothetical protein [Gammaproteobacteria bacterium]
MNLITELDLTIKMLEARIPASVEGNEKLVKALQNDMEKYFNDLERAFPYDRLEKIYNKYMEPEKEMR